MDQATTGIQPLLDGHGLNGRLKAGVDVYVPADDPCVIYVRSAGTWFRYERSGTDLEAGTPEALNGGNGSVHGQVPANPHWAGYYDGESLELVRERRPRVYYDPYQCPGLFVTDGGPPRAPLPVLEMNGHLEDSEPWLDPTTGDRFTGDQARTLTAVLRYAPRKDQAIFSAGESRQTEQMGVLVQPMIGLSSGSR
jgi:hypothetical protein